MARKTGKKKRRMKGSKVYAFSYALSSMRAYPFRALSLALTLSLGLSLIGSVLIWADTGVQVSVDEYFDDSSFQMLLKGVPGQTEQVDSAEAYAKNSEIIEKTYRLNSTVGLALGTQLPDDTLYGKSEPMYSSGIKDCEVIFVNNELLDTIRPAFTIEGRFALESGEIVVSKQFANYFYDVFGYTLTINSTVDFELLERRSSQPIATIGSMGHVSTPEMKVVGVYEIKGYNSIIELGFPSLLRSNYEQHNYDTPVFGIRDSVMMLSSDVDVGPVSELGFFGARTFLRASAGALIEAGVTEMADNLLVLKARMDEQFDVTVEGLDEIMYLQGLVDTYLETLPLSLLNLPIFILALFLSVFAADTFMSARNTEVSALRSKGASSSQIYAIFFFESVLIAVFSIVAGIFLSILFSALIPSAVGFMTFDWELYTYYLSNSIVTTDSILYSILLCIVPPLLFILYSARKAAHTEIGSTIMETADPVDTGRESYRFTLGVSVFLLLMVVGAILFIPTNPVMLLLELGLGTAAWFFMAYNGSRITRVGFANLSKRLTFVLGEKNIIAAGNLRMRKGRIVPLMVVLALTLSSTIAFTVQAESYQADLEREIEYALGADLRVGCTPRLFEFNETLESYPGVNRAVPILQTTGTVGTEKISIEAVNPLEYELVGHFDGSSFEGEDSSTALSRLSSVPNGIIISRYHAERLNKSIGDELNLVVTTRLSQSSITFVITGLVKSAPGFGYAAAVDIPSSRLGAGFGYQAPNAGFALANIDYISKLTGITTASLFLADLVCVSDQGILLRALHDLSGVTATTPESFNLHEISFGTALFLSTVQGLFSIGFAMSLLLSMFALTLFLGSIVRERTRDYAILRAVGSSRRQVIKMVLSEFTGIVLASLTLSLILGTLFGFVQSAIIFTMSPFARILQVAITFPIGFLTVVLLAELLAMIAGAYFPAREASKTDPAIVLRNL